MNDIQDASTSSTGLVELRSEPCGLGRSATIPSAVDWSKPIEAVRKVDEKVVPLVRGVLGNRHHDGRYFTDCPDPDETNGTWYADGTDVCYKNLWFIRNDASAIEARRAETGTGSVHESAVPKGDAQ